MTMTLVETVTVGSGGAASIEFTNIPQTGKDLLVVFSLRDSAANNGFFMTLNNSSASNYSRRILQGNGSTVGSSSFSSQSSIFIYGGNVGSDKTANTFSNGQIYIPNYTSSANKSVSADNVQENNASESIQHILAGLFADSTAISSVELDAGTSFVQYSTASLYIVS